MPVSLLNPDTLNDNVNSVLLDAYAGALFWKWSVPMTLINLVLFRWISRTTPKHEERAHLSSLETDTAATN